MKTDDVDSFASMFLEPPGARREIREQRAKKERRTQLTERQRDRSAVRTDQINFRCAPEFKSRLAEIQKKLGRKDWSYADILEDALELFAEKHKIAG